MTDPRRTPGKAPTGGVVIDDAAGAVRLEHLMAGTDSGRGRWIAFTASWVVTDPLTVLLTVSARPDHPALPRGRWAVLRDFLRYGLTEPTGDGDVRLHPEVAADGSALLVLTLARNGRPCRVRVPAAVLGEFLDRTEERVPVGAERSEALVDEVIARLLQA